MHANSSILCTLVKGVKAHCTLEVLRQPHSPPVVDWGLQIFPGTPQNHNVLSPGIIS